MKITFYGVSILLFLAGMCEGEEETVKPGLPPCVQTIIEGMESEPVRNPPAELWRVTAPGKIYYYIPPYCCDIASILIDADCNTICSPDGGITGQGDGNCPDVQELKREVIWRDERTE